MISIYCDGSSHARADLPGGWAYVIVRNDEPLLADSGAHPSTTNNIMELTAVHEGIKALVARGWHATGEAVEVVSDSKYALGILDFSLSPMKNLDLVKEIREIALVARVAVRWVRGHSGVYWNEKVDGLAHDAKQTLVPEKVKRKQLRKAQRKAAKNGDDNA